MDFFCSSDEINSRLSESSILCSASKGTQFLYYLQMKGITALDQVEEDDIISFFIKDGNPTYEASYRYVRLQGTGLMGWIERGCA